MLEKLTITKALELLNSDQITSVQLVEYYLDQIQKLNPQYNALLYICDKEELIQRAKEADNMRKNSDQKLLGIPFVVKDSFMTLGTPTTAGDNVLRDAQSEYNATVIQKLMDEGAILLGKTNMDSWGFGSSTENSAYGVTKNPFDQNKVAGGSSGGSAAAVALDMCVFALGEDTGGSIRQPSCYCGVYGLKPTYGRISRYGCIAYASSLDSVGPITKSANDIEYIFTILEGDDQKDMTHVKYKSKAVRDAKKVFAYSMDFIPEGVSQSLRDQYLETIEKFKALGYKAIEFKFSLFNEVIPTYYITAMSEASTDLSRYQGTRFGKMYDKLKQTDFDYKSKSIPSWEDLFTTTRTEGFGNEAKRRIVLGAYVLSEGYFDAYYKQAQRIRNMIFAEFQKIFEQVDFVLSPVAPSSALTIGSKITNPVEMYLEDIYTVTANLAGIPGLAFPIGVDDQNMPIGMQIMGDRGSDELLCQIVADL